MQVTNPPKIIITGIKGGSGKTILSLGVCVALIKQNIRQGLKVVPFKKGPDYIDAAWLSCATKHPCFNLDQFLMTDEQIKRSFLTRSQGADFSLVEGNRGLYDGVDEKGSYSSAELAKLLNLPVILVIDVTKMTRTAAALALGCKMLDPNVEIKGVVLNNVAQTKHEAVVRRSIEEATGIPVLGAIKRMKKDPLPMRHLGVTPAFEYEGALNALDELGKIIEGSVDVEAIKKIAKDTIPFSFTSSTGTNTKETGRKIKIGVFRDKAFQFYYPENLEALEQEGAKLVFIDSLNDTSLPEDIYGLYIGGGFPETQAKGLSANISMRKSVQERLDKGLVCYAECGGLMYLGSSILWEENSYPMAGVLGWEFVMQKKPVGHGYSAMQATKANPFYEDRQEILGHEFHYSKPVLKDETRAGDFACKVTRGFGFDGKNEGLVYKNVFGTYIHVHALSDIGWAKGFMDCIKNNLI